METLAEDTIESMVARVRANRLPYGLPCPNPTPESILTLCADGFAARFGQPLPAGIRTLLRASNGLVEEDLVVWPAERHGPFAESLVSANLRLRATVSNRFVYFGRRDRAYFAQRTADSVFVALETDTLRPWIVFEDDHALALFVLRQALEL